MIYHRSRVIGFAFLFLSVASTIYIAAATVNYLGLFPALDQVQVEIVSLSLVRSTGVNQSSLSSLVRVSNPTGYSGFQVSDIRLALYLYAKANASMTLFNGTNQLTAKQTVMDSLRPNSIYSANIVIDLTSQQAADLSSFANKYNNQVTAWMFLTVDIATFLESPTGPITYTRTQDIPLSFS